MTRLRGTRIKISFRLGQNGKLSSRITKYIHALRFESTKCSLPRLASFASSHRSVSDKMEKTVRRDCFLLLSARLDSNQGPRRYKLRALPTELQAVWQYCIAYDTFQQTANLQMSVNDDTQTNPLPRRAK